ncbi:MAG: family 78 glycoside hydrolase catalytic domain [Bacteroides sp.]|nr:family 78 glycoside hydrolase catalytic domain [Bacteroides sp.]
MRPGEYLTPEGRVNQNNSGYNYWFSYTPAGESTESWKPAFSYYGFRYIQVEGAVPEGEPNPDDLPVIEELTSLHVRNASERVGEVSCSSPLFNDIYSLIDWSVRSNMASVLTDCPHREKLGWLEVAHLMSHSIAYGYDIKQMYTQTLVNMKNSQYENGLIPSTAPEFAHFPGDFHDSPEWGSAAIIPPWFLYQWYGDASVIADYYPMMEKYINYLHSRTDNHILYHGLGDWYDLGPAHPGYSQLTARGLTPTAIYYYDLHIMACCALLLGNEEEARYYEELADEVKKAFNEKFFDREKGYYDRGSQTANAMPLYLGIVEPEYREQVLGQIIQNIREQDNSITSGDIGFSYLLRVLERENASEVIFDMNNQTHKPGYGYQLMQGATSLTESWTALQTASHNHCMLGHLLEWFYSGLGGIKTDPDALAYKRFMIRPDPVGDITSARVTFESPYGKIFHAWEKRENRYKSHITIPANTTAVICLPEAPRECITENGVPVDNNPSVTYLGTDGKYTMYEAGSGTYCFEVEKP